MSRTRIVKGKYTKVSLKGHSMYSNESIITNATKTVTEKGSEKGISYGEPEKPKEGEIQSKCLVEFRPHANWNGEFGFDWVRLGDTGVSGDKKWYKSIIGNYRNPSTKLLEQIYYNGIFFKDSKEYQNLLNKFGNMTIPWKPKINGNPYLYPIPYMTMYKGDSHKITLKIEIEELPKKLSIKHLKKPQDTKEYFKFNKEEISIKKGKYTLDNYLQITCINSFGTDQTIEVLADDKVCGRMKILANDAAHQKHGKVLFVSVKSSSGPGKIKNGITTGEKERLIKYLRQAYINVDIKSINMDLTKDRNFIPKLQSGSGIHQYLDAKLSSAKFPDGKVVGNQYDSFYKVYFIAEVIQLPDGQYLLGEAENIPSKTVYILDLKNIATTTGNPFEAVKTTATHELLHAIGLYHTFDNQSPLTFKKYNTDNIMDYYISDTNIKAKQTYKWQWDILKSKI